jgi:hypothetical protein
MDLLRSRFAFEEISWDLSHVCSSAELDEYYV